MIGAKEARAMVLEKMEVSAQMEMRDLETKIQNAVKINTFSFTVEKLSQAAKLKLESLGYIIEFIKGYDCQRDWIPDKYTIKF